MYTLLKLILFYFFHKRLLFRKYKPFIRKKVAVSSTVNIRQNCDTTVTRQIKRCNIIEKVSRTIYWKNLRKLLKDVKWSARKNIRKCFDVVLKNCQWVIHLMEYLVVMKWKLRGNPNIKNNVLVIMRWITVFWKTKPLKKGGLVLRYLEAESSQPVLMFDWLPLSEHFHYSKFNLNGIMVISVNERELSSCNFAKFITTVI